MKLYVKCESEMEALGISMALNQYTLNHKAASWKGAIGVLFDTETLRVGFCSATPLKFDKMAYSYQGVENIRDILMGVRELEIGQGIKVTVNPHRRRVMLEGFNFLTFDDVAKINQDVNPAPVEDSKSLVGKVVVFTYRKEFGDWLTRIVLVKEETKSHLSGLDVMDSFQFKTFRQGKVADLKVVK
jgi:hypothetical protein